MIVAKQVERTLSDLEIIESISSRVIPKTLWNWYLVILSRDAQD